MADIADIANEVVAQCTMEAERRARIKWQPEFHPEFDGYHCVECGEQIPTLRLAQRRVRCVACQTEVERVKEREARNGRAG